MFIAQAFKYLHEGWRYLVGFIIIFVVSQLGSIPLIGAVAFSLMNDGKDMGLLEDPNTLMTTLESNLTFFLLLFGFALGLLALYLVVKHFHKQPFLTVTTSRKKTDWGRIWFGFLLITITTLTLTIFDYYGNPEDYELQFKLGPFLILALIAIIMIPLQTSFEEYLFRGYLMQGIGVIVKNRWFPLIITSVVFGGLHYFNPEVEKLGNIVMIYYIGTGFFLGIITLMDEGMELALGFHAGNNLITALLVTSDWTVFQTHSILKDVAEPAAGFDVIIPVLVIYPIFIAIMAFRYKWKDWGEKLFGRVEAPTQTIQENTL